jgi:hypothetical protein
MTKEQAFEALNTFCKQAHFASHVYDVYHGDKLFQVHFIIYDSDKPDAKFVAQIIFDNFFVEEEYLLELWIRNKMYQLFDFNACSDLIKTINYETVQ